MISAQTIPYTPAGPTPAGPTPASPASANNIGGILRQARLRQNLSLRALAKRAHTSHATLSAYESNHKVPNATTFLRILEACDYAVDVVLHPRIRSRHGMSRGEELAEVLTLAEQFPSKPAKQLTFPVFGKTT